jgi:NAD(P)-dependent dehydrogenase (short-subunit alcohol dehydrogenase family)
VSEGKGRFEGLTVLVSGATGGFGSAMSARFAAEGANLVLTDVDETALDELAASLDARTAKLAGDITDERLSKNLVKLAVAEFGRLDIAANNAGIAQSAVKLHQVPAQEARDIIDVDVMAVFYAMKYQLHQMDRQFRETGKGGAIVNTSSVAGVGGAPRLSVYSAAKHAVVGLTRSAALEYARSDIRVNAVCPAYARTAMAMHFIDIAPQGREEAEAEMTRGVPMRRLATVDEVVGAILFAADPANSFMTGQAIAVDGGISAI